MRFDSEVTSANARRREAGGVEAGIWNEGAIRVSMCVMVSLSCPGFFFKLQQPQIFDDPSLMVERWGFPSD